MSDLPTDDELMARLTAGEVEAFGELHSRYSPKVLTFLARLTGDHHIAEDLLQETFLRLWRGRGEYQACGHFPAWLFTIARRVAIDHRRSRKPDLETADTLQVLDTVEAPDGPLRSDERFADIEQALAALPSGQREILLLSRFAGLDAGEIAAVVGSTPGAIRVALHRTLKRIRATLAP